MSLNANNRELVKRLVLSEVLARRGEGPLALRARPRVRPLVRPVELPEPKNPEQP